MRHDDSSKRPETDAALAPPVSAPRARSDDAGELYVPGDDDVEMIDQAELSADGEEIIPADAEEIVPADGELELTDMPAYTGAPFDPGAVPSDPDLAFLDRAPGEQGDDLGAPLFDVGADPQGAELGGELIVEPWADKPSEARVPVSIRPTGSRMSTPPLPHPPALPSEGAGAGADAGTGEAAGSPWATDAAASIDVDALPSSHASFALAEEKPAAKPPPAATEPASGSRSWLTIFLAIVLFAGGATFLVLRVQSGQKPQEPQSTGAPIAVPTGPKPAVPPPPQTPSVAPSLAPSQEPEPPATSASAASPDAPSEAPSDAPSGSAAPTSSVVSIPTVMVTNPPSGATTGTSKTPTGPKQSSKKPSRIF